MKATFNEREKMKSANSTIVAVVIAGCFSLTAYVMGQGHAPGGGVTNTSQGTQGQSTQNMNSARGTTSSSSAVPTASASASGSPSMKGTPPGHHYGWQKGKHNPNRSP